MNDNKGYEERVLIERVYKKVFESLLEWNKREEKKTLTLPKKRQLCSLSKKRSNFYKNSETNSNVVLIYIVLFKKDTNHSHSPFFMK